MRNLVLFAGVCLFTAASASAAQQSGQAGLPPQVEQLLACRSLADPAQRLACYDRHGAVVGQAIAAREIVLIDREGARSASRSLFGFKVPNFGGILGGEENEVREIESSVTDTRRNPEGSWMVRLADGSTWSQTDDTVIAIAPRKGHKAVVRRGSLGSFFLRLNGQPGVRVQRVR